MAASVQQSLWVQAINENLFEALAKIMPASTNDSQYRNAKTIYVPQAGNPGTVLKDPARPLTVTTRTDTYLSYLLNEWVMPPRVALFEDENALSYDKLKSLVADIIGGLPQRVFREILINWYPGNTYAIGTTGANAAAHAPAGTGNRKSMVFADALNASKALDNMEYPDSDRYLICDRTMGYQLLTDLGIQAARGAELMNASSLTLPPVAGFNVIMVNRLAYVHTDGVVRPFGHAGATTDSAVALAVHKSALSWASGDVKLFYNQDDATMVGTVVSGALWAGGKYRREDKLGVVPIIQTTP
jgi:hypothetical protein